MSLWGRLCPVHTGFSVRNPRVCMCVFPIVQLRNADNASQNSYSCKKRTTPGQRDWLFEANVKQSIVQHTADSTKLCSIIWGGERKSKVNKTNKQAKKKNKRPAKHIINIARGRTTMRKPSCPVAQGGKSLLLPRTNATINNDQWAGNTLGRVGLFRSRTLSGERVVFQWNFWIVCFWSGAKGQREERSEVKYHSLIIIFQWKTVFTKHNQHHQTPRPFDQRRSAGTGFERVFPARPEMSTLLTVGSLSEDSAWRGGKGTGEKNNTSNKQLIG